MIGLVLVSHSEPLAQATADLAMQMVHDVRPEIRLAGGAAGGFGTDAAAIAAAVDELAEVASGVVLITDLGSAVLSASLALDIRSSTVPVRISSGPFVEATTAAVVVAAAGASLDVVCQEANQALLAKQSAQEAEEPEVHEAASAPESSDAASGDVELINPQGLHSRPAAVLVRTASGYESAIEITNLTAERGPVKAASLIGILSLAAAGGHTVRIDAQGPDAAEAVAALSALIAEGFGEA
ncbi:MAG TPA: HPr family phosphocarrier protein [Microbacterium sp.]|uniref:HPr family phosphocarrier protein n=1 Tax=Microbacterium sp. TaxID=51671 RepID=UPI000ECD9DAE|nr:HPr family phosphocarrier protein [Microbacterium sp.]